MQLQRVGINAVILVSNIKVFLQPGPNKREREKKREKAWKLMAHADLHRAGLKILSDFATRFHHFELPWQPHFLVFPRFFPLVAFADNSTTGGSWEMVRKFTRLLRTRIDETVELSDSRGVAAKGIVSNARYDFFFPRR